MYRIVAGLALLAAPVYAGPAADGDELERRLERCIRAVAGDRAGMAQTDAIVDLQQRCPGLWPGIEAGPLGAVLQPGGGSMTLGGLLDLRVLVRANRASAVPSPLDPGAIGGVLAQAWQSRSEAGEQTWWQRFKAWLQARLGSDDELEFPLWLEDWLRSWRPSTGVLEVLLWSLPGIVLAMVAAVVVTELRAAGWFPRRRRGKAVGEVAEGVPQPGRGLRRAGLEGVEGLPPGRRAVALMNALLGLLRERGWLPLDESRTNRELLALLRPAHGAESLLLGRVLEQSEAWLYGGRPPEERVLRSLLAEVRGLASQSPAHSPRVPATLAADR